jgi:uncharacterized protein (DUF2252 family)
VFDLNDFDETLPGPFEWDLKRLAASLAVAGRANGYPERDRRRILLAAAEAYRGALAGFAGMGNLGVWYAHLEVEELLPRVEAQLDRRRAKALRTSLAKVRTRDSVQALAKLTRPQGGELRIVSQPPLIVPLQELLGEVDAATLTQELAGLLRRYGASLPPDRRHLLSQYRLVQVARKVVGVGSVGTRAWIGLLVGRDGADPLLLQLKEAQASVLERFLARSRHRSHGQRVVAGQRLMQAASDIFLGWERVTGLDGQDRDFYVRQLRDWKASADPEAMRAKGMVVYAQLCGWTLARAHARSGDRIAIAAYLGRGDGFDRAILAFAEAYADQNDRDHQALQAAVKAGRVEATTGL